MKRANTDEMLRTVTALYHVGLPDFHMGFLFALLGNHGGAG